VRRLNRGAQRSRREGGATKEEMRSAGRRGFYDCRGRAYFDARCRCSQRKSAQRLGKRCCGCKISAVECVGAMLRTAVSGWFLT